MAAVRYTAARVFIGRSGLSAQAALEAATTVAAGVAGLEAEVGELAAGRFADMVAVGGDPCVDIRALRDVRLVIQRGRTIPPAARRRDSD